MSGLWQDVRYAARMLHRFPGFTAFAVTSLAIGIGASTAVYGLVHALFLKPFAPVDPGSLVAIHQTLEGRRDVAEYEISFTDYLYYRDHSRVFERLAAQYPGAPLHVVSAGEAVTLTGSVVTWNYFPLLGLEPELGRFFTREEDTTPDRDRVAVISHDLFHSRFAAAPETLGATVTINGAAFTIVGVAPRGFHGAMPGLLRTDVWIPSAMLRFGYRPCDGFARTCRMLALLGRLRDGTTLTDAQAEMDVLARQLEAAHPDTNQGRGIRVRSARGIRLQEQTGYTLSAQLLAATVGLVLLAACANVSGLLLARGVRRRKEIAVRQALGSGRRRIVRQLLIESLLLALMAGGAGLLVASWTNDLLALYFGTNAAGTPVNFALGLDRTVLGISLLLSLLTTVVFGLVPALQASRPQIGPVLKDEAPAGGATRSWLRDGLIVFQMALTAMLAIGAALLLQSAGHLHRGPGFDVDRLALVRVRPSLAGYDLAKARAVQAAVVQRLEALPGVAGVSTAEFPPLPGWGGSVAVLRPGDSGDGIAAGVQRIGPRYFHTLNVPLVEGRAFDERDRESAPPAAIVNQALASRLSPAAPIVGTTVMVGGEPHVVIGVARDAQYLSIAEQARPAVFLDFWHAGGTLRDSFTHIRVDGDPRAMLPAIRRAIAEVDPGVPTAEVQALSDRAAAAFRTVRGLSTMLVWLGGVALLLGAIGLYSVLSFTVSQRTREVAIRVALGATRDRIARLVVGRGVLLSLAGVAAGLAGGAAASRTLVSLLYGVRSLDPLTFALVPLLLIAVALAACYLPARRAARVDPIVALRAE